MLTPDAGLAGLLFIGDPHLASRVPGFRCDDYPEVILGKLAWALDYARRERLVPVILGDWFHWPRDNANWLLVRLFTLLAPQTLSIYGNHDCSEGELTPDDTLSLLVHAGAIRLLSDEQVWTGVVAGCDVVVGGTSWGRRIPRAWPPTAEPGAAGSAAARRPRVFWATHHHVAFSGYAEEARVRPREIPGIDVVVNGHLHRPQEDIRVGATAWLNPGNIARATRGDASRAREPSVLRIDLVAGEPGWRARPVVVPHAPFEAVFHAVDVAESGPVGSSFVRGLEQLAALRTDSGAGLHAFLEQNLGEFEAPVAEQIRALAREVCSEQFESQA